MKFSIGTASSSLEFEEDMRLIKSSLLYADEIELIGMAEYAVFTYFPRCITEKRLSLMRRPFLLYYGIEGMISNQKTVFLNG